MDSPLAHSPTLAAQPATATGSGTAERIPPGTRAGEYVIDRFLGAGAMGEVYAGHHPVIGKKVAIKVIKQGLAGSEEAAERFTREARAVNQVDHPNVIDVFSYGRLDDGRLYLVMDLVAGESLRARLNANDGPLLPEEALAILSKIAGALDAAHARGVVHRDLKPDNVMLGERGVFVLDFGIAKLVSGEATQGNGTLTGQGTWLGTPAYMAPEQWSTDGAGPASDRYALGVIAFEILAGKLPFAASSVPAMMEQHFRAAVPALSLRGSTQPQLDAVMQRALAKDPDQRYATAHELVEALRAATGAGEAERPGRPTPALKVAAAFGVATLVIWIAGTVIIANTHGSGSDSKPAGGDPRLVDVEVTSTPAGALVAVDGKVMGATPMTLHLTRDTNTELVVTKPGYLPSRRPFAVGADATQLAVNLGPVTRFEGVWKLPNGELRAFERNGERVAVSKLAAVDGKRELYKQYPFVAVARTASPNDDAESIARTASPAGAAAPNGDAESIAHRIAFALDDEVIDPRAPDEPSCHVPVHVEYRYDAARDTLELVRPIAKVDFVGGQCVPRAQTISTERLIRVDATATETVEMPAPAGNIDSKPTKLAVPPAKKRFATKAAAVEKPQVLPFSKAKQAAPNETAQQATVPAQAAAPPSNQAQQVVEPQKRQ